MMKGVKATVSISDELFHKADEVASGRGLNRSQFYAEALAAYLRELEDDAVTRDIDAAVDLASADNDDLAAWSETAGRATFARNR
jgi:metal-responsive CopG/Arc/MetJ family transcriptional regulator